MVILSADAPLPHNAFPTDIQKNSTICKPEKHHHELLCQVFHFSYHQLYYITSGLSFYFIYDFCLYSNMSPLVSYFLRFLPLLILIITATVVLSVRYINV